MRRAGISLLTVLACGLVLGGVSWAEQKLASIQSVQYNSQAAELSIQTNERVPLDPQSPTHNARRKEISFFIPNTMLQPTPKIVTVENNALVKSFILEQRALNGIPAVRVSAQLYSNSPYVPFAVTRSANGLNMMIATDHSQLQPAVKAIAPAKPKEEIISPRVKGNAKATVPSQSQPKSITTVPSTAVAQPVQPMAVGGSAAATGNTVTAIFGPVAASQFSVITDLYYDDNALSVVSSALPISVQRSFTLTEPNRFVVDIAPAVLQSRALTRAIPISHPEISNIRSGQLDDHTVRVVVQFTNKTLPVDLSQWEKNRVLKLNFDSNRY